MSFESQPKYNNPSLDGDDSEESALLQGRASDENCLINEADLYEVTVKSCGFGQFQFILLLVCGWAIASDSVEVQVRRISLF